MNHAGSLRHSKAHRMAVKRIEAGKTYLWALMIPERMLLEADGVIDLLGLPAGSVVNNVVRFSFLNEYHVDVAVPKLRRLILPHGVTGHCRGPVKS
jgi:hypothetical protein